MVPEYKSGRAAPGCVAHGARTALRAVAMLLLHFYFIANRTPTKTFEPGVA
jgi:hypothetical protein